ncbi:MAG TPA: polynucleotide adenylyltransferase PcnB [Anaeromyxobacteraceae bacterium]|jgi:poly(A) polymerase
MTAPHPSHDVRAGDGHPPHRETQRRRGEAPPPRHRDLALDVELPALDHEPEIPLERIDMDAVKVVSRLRHTGHQAYLVGGCVRDVLLGRTPKDFDVATSAHPGEVRAVFRNCRLIGRRFRLAHVYFRGGKVVEVATFRQNPVDVGDDVPEAGDLLITRDNVFGTAEEDARRRDFTVNGLFYDVFTGEVLDYVGGRADLEARRIATIGDPEVRMREDPVRALRAVRFAARLGFAIEPETFAAMRRHAAELSRCAPPRVLEEIFKILRCGGSARALEVLRAAGALPVVLPALADHLEEQGEEGRRRVQAHLAALDEAVRSGGEVSDAVLLGALLVHLPRAEGGGPSPAEELLDQLVATARLPRRVAERTRLALGAQRALRAPPRRRRRGVAGQTYFADAIQLLAIAVRATGEGAESLAQWRSAAQGHADGGPRQGEPGEEAPGEEQRPGPPAEAGAAERGPRRRRRRRGGRRRGRRGRGGSGPEASPPA